jgi:ABC-type dipeptide/oligopeptide/nickel transport system ATPase component
LLNLPPGCAFENRCGRALAQCKQSAPEETVMDDQRILRCFNKVEQS